MKTFIIGLTGFAGSGKDTAAQFLDEALSARQKKVRRMAFADPIRAGLNAMGVPMHYMTERSLKETAVPGFSGASYRKLAQTLGTEWGRVHMGRDFWVNLVEQRLLALADLHRMPQVLIMTDVRFQSEADWIKLNGGILVHVQRPDIAPVRAHESEQLVEGIEHVLLNDADLPALRARCDKLHLTVLAHMALEGFA